MKVASNDAELDVADEGAGPAILLMHPLGLNKQEWDAQAAVLRADARVVRIDMRGMGASTFFRAFPERVTGLGLLSLGAAGDPAASDQFHVLADAVDRDGMEPFVAALLEKNVGATTRRERPAILAAVRRTFEEADPRGVSASLRGLAMREDASDLLADIDVPTLVGAGLEDELAPFAGVEAMAKRISCATFVGVASGHLLPLEAPDVTTGILRRLIDAVVERSAVSGSTRRS